MKKKRDRLLTKQRDSECSTKKTTLTTNISPVDASPSRAPMATQQRIRLETYLTPWCSRACRAPPLAWVMGIPAIVPPPTTTTGHLLPRLLPINMTWSTLNPWPTACARFATFQVKILMSKKCNIVFFFCYHL